MDAVACREHVRILLAGAELVQVDEIQIVLGGKAPDDVVIVVQVVGGIIQPVAAGRVVAAGGADVVPGQQHGLRAQTDAALDHLAVVALVGLGVEQRLAGVDDLRLVVHPEQDDDDVRVVRGDVGLKPRQALRGVVPADAGVDDGRAQPAAEHLHPAGERGDAVAVRDDRLVAELALRGLRADGEDRLVCVLPVEPALGVSRDADRVAAADGQPARRNGVGRLLCADVGGDGRAVAGDGAVVDVDDVALRTLDGFPGEREVGRRVDRLLPADVGGHLRQRARRAVGGVDVAVRLGAYGDFGVGDKVRPVIRRAGGVDCAGGKVDAGQISRVAHVQRGDAVIGVGRERVDIVHAAAGAVIVADVGAEDEPAFGDEGRLRRTAADRQRDADDNVGLQLVAVLKSRGAPPREIGAAVDRFAMRGRVEDGVSLAAGVVDGVDAQHKRRFCRRRGRRARRKEQARGERCREKERG